MGALNEQELAVLRMAAEGLSNSAIAEAQNLSEKRVRNIMSTIYQKFNLTEVEGVNLRVSAVNRARVLGMLPK
jgi:DNA-binding NarL/FixJ family response regulator